MEGVLVEEGSVDFKAVSVDEIEDTVFITISVVLSVTFADSVADTVAMLCELTLIALDR